MRKILFLGALAVLLSLGLVLANCDDDSKGNNKGSGSGTGGSSGGSSGIGCSTLSAGTKCTAKSSCSSKFLCLTGQGSDNNCTDSCSCQ